MSKLKYPRPRLGSAEGGQIKSQIRITKVFIYFWILSFELALKFEF